jgi:lipopolysaccharide export LptBFGC system permease protein LptF
VLKAFVASALVITPLIYLVEMIEAMRDFDGALPDKIYIAVLLKTLISTEYAAPLIFLIATALMFYNSSRTQELLSYRIAGFSLLNIAMPVYLFGLVMAVLWLLVVTPIKSSLWNNIKDNYSSSKIVNIHSNIGFNDRIWFKQKNFIISAKSADIHSKRLLDVMIFRLNKGDFNLNQRIHTNSINTRDWLVDTGYIVEDDGLVTSIKKPISLGIDASFDDIIKDDAKPEVISIWDFEEVIATRKSMGLNYEDYYFKYLYYLITPLWFAIMALVSARFMASYNQRSVVIIIRNTVMLLMAGLVIIVVKDSSYTLMLSNKVSLFSGLLTPIILITLLFVWGVKNNDSQ